MFSDERRPSMDIDTRTIGFGPAVRVRVLEVPYQPEAAGDWLL